MCLAIWIAGVESTEYRWCCKSAKEATKCTTLAALRYANLTKPFKFNCVQAFGTAKCIEKLKNREADVMILDAGDINANKDDLYMVAVENTEDTNTVFSGTGYYAVAAVRKGAEAELTLKTAVDYKTCHTGVGKTAGWNMPMGWFKRNGVDPSRIPSSCAPGAKLPKYSSFLPDTNTDKWCENCMGSDDKKNNQCARDQRERYYGYDGAFSCMKDEYGDVAFIKQTTIPKDEQSEYQLLCPDGTRKNVDQFEDCNIAHVPPHALVARKSFNNDDDKDDADALDKIFKNLESSWDDAAVVAEKFKGGKDLLWGSKVHNFIKINKSTKLFLEHTHDYTCNMKAALTGKVDTGCLPTIIDNTDTTQPPKTNK